MHFCLRCRVTFSIPETHAEIMTDAPSPDTRPEPIEAPNTTCPHCQHKGRVRITVLKLNDKPHHPWRCPDCHRTWVERDRREYERVKLFPAE